MVKASDQFSERDPGYMFMTTERMHELANTLRDVLHWSMPKICA
jgi:hypothetical protein